jgi:hypothetical protein
MKKKSEKEMQAEPAETNLHGVELWRRNPLAKKNA